MLVEKLSRTHNALLDCVAELSSEELRKQYHADLSPLGWHLGHVAFIGQYWLYEVVLGDNSRTAALHEQFLPERIEKTDRQNLPGIDDLSSIAASYRDIEHLLNSLLSEATASHHLLENDYIGWFLLQHAAQHLETLHMVLQQRQIKINRGQTPFTEQLGSDSYLSQPDAIALPDCIVEDGIYPIGSSSPTAYDNECPPFEIELDGFRIASTQVSNAQYLAFMLDGGYERPEFWSDSGWQWSQRHSLSSPQHWHGEQASWYQSSPVGASRLDPKEAVTGLGWYEADAFARYACCRLPHETEWEAAVRSNPDLWPSAGGSWEWCANTLYPYEGFRAFPYERYSQPWFDNSHYVMRGAGPYTNDSVRRPSFRNFYTADKRYAFTGLRLAADL
jgi:ergothioneine biosynthesis protein EgtB